MKELVAERVPPGDRWALINEDSDIVFDRDWETQYLFILS